MAAITPRYSTVNDQFSTVSTVELFTGDLTPDPCIIPAAELPAGGDFLVISSATYGASDASSNPVVALTYGRGATYFGYSSGEGNSHGVPEAMRTGHWSGFHRLSTDGTKDLEFSYRTLNAARTLYVKGCSMVAIQLNESGAELTEDADFWHEAQAADVDLVDSYTDLVTLTANITEGGEYILLASASCYAFSSSPGDERMMRVRLNSIATHKDEWVKEIEDARDNQQMSVVSRLTMSPGTHTITIQGAGTGLGTKRFTNGNIWLFRKAKFRNVGAYSGVADNQIVLEYSMGYQQVVTPTTFTPSGAENLVVLGNGFFRRTNGGSIVSRLRNTTTDTPLHDFCADINVSEIDQDISTHLCCGVVPVSAARTFVYEACSEDGFGAFPYVYVDYPELLLWPMTLAGTVAADHEEELTEAIAIVVSDTASAATTTVPITESSVAVGPDFAYDPDNPLQVESIDETTPITITDSAQAALVNSTVVPVAHPRIYLTAATLSRLRTDAGYDDNGVQVNPPGSTFWQNLLNQGTKEAWHNCLIYKVTQNTAYRDTCIAQVESQIASHESPGTLRMGDNYLEYRDFMRRVALPFDWLWNELDDATKTRWMDFMDVATFVCHNDNSISNGIFDDGDWATAEPTQNFYAVKLGGSVLVALATYYERRPTFTWEGQTYVNSWALTPRNNNSAGGPVFTDLWEFVVAKFEQQARPQWDLYAYGGGWTEGQNYSRAAARSIGELSYFIKQVTGGGVDWFMDPAHPFIRQMPVYYLYYNQPGNRTNNPDGDCSGGNTRGAANDYDRIRMLWMAAGLEGTAEGEYAQYWLTHDYTSITPGHASSRNIAMDFFMYDAARPERDYSVLPLAYHAAGGVGFVNSRSSWADDAVSITSHARDNWRNHQHQDNCGVHFFRGTGQNTDDWICCEAQGIMSQHDNGANSYVASIWHNVFILAGTGQRKNPSLSTSYPPVATVEAFASASDYAYWRMQGDDAYWTNGGQGGNYHGDVKINDIWKRDVLHIHPGYVIVYDRVRMMPGFASSLKQQIWHYPTNPTVNAGEIVASQGTNRIFQAVMVPSSPTITIVDEGALEPLLGSYRAEITGTTAQFEDFLNVFLVTSTATSAMPTLTLITSSSGNMKGAHIEDATEEAVVLFATSQDGTTPSNIDYSYTEGATPVTSYVCDLLPDTGYSIITNLVTTTRNVTILVGGSYRTDEGGVLTFDAGNLAPPPTFERTITENPVSLTDLIADLDATDEYDENAITMGTDTIQSFLLPAVADTDEITESDITVTDLLVPTTTVPITETTVTLSDLLVPTATVPASDTITMGTDTVQVTLYAPTVPPGPTPDPDDTGNRIDTTVQMDTSIDRGPSWQ